MRFSNENEEMWKKGKKIRVWGELKKKGRSGLPESDFKGETEG